MNILLLFIGIAVLVGGGLLFSKNRKLSIEGIKIEADIIDVLKKKEQSTDADGYTSTSNIYYPVFTYSYNGQDYTKESKVGVSNKRKYKKGGKLSIVFMPDTPDKPKMQSFSSLYLFPVILFIVGLVIIISSFLA